MKVESTTVTVEGPVRSVRIPSMTRSDTSYTVMVSCGCPGFIYNGHCYHLAEAGKQLKREATAVRFARR